MAPPPKLNTALHEAIMEHATHPFRAAELHRSHFRKFSYGTFRNAIAKLYAAGRLKQLGHCRWQKA